MFTYLESLIKCRSGNGEMPCECTQVENSFHVVRYTRSCLARNSSYLLLSSSGSSGYAGGLCFAGISKGLHETTQTYVIPLVITAEKQTILFWTIASRCIWSIREYRRWSYNSSFSSIAWQVGRPYVSTCIYGDWRNFRSGSRNMIHVIFTRTLFSALICWVAYVNNVLRKIE
jgi:hypothetical protein